MSEPFRFHPVPVPEAAPVRWPSRASGRVTGPGVRWLLVLGIGLLHGLAIWALQAGMGVRSVEAVVPVQVLDGLLDNAPSPSPPAPPPSASASPAPAHAVPTAPVARPVKPMPEPAPVQPPTAALPEPAAAVTAVAAPTVVAPATDPAPAAPVAASPVPAIEQPSSDAAYLRNPPPAYPRQSVLLGEQGQVVLRVFIDADGRASQAEILRSSGFERLDQVALQTVRRWRYVPGKRAGVPEAMWTTVPLSFVLD